MDGVGGGATGGGGGSEGENKNSAEGGEPKVKRKMKTAFQLHILEKTYAGEAYPSEQLRADLSAQLGLTDRQLQMWFCHRRLKDRKTPPVKRPKKEISGSGGGGGDTVASGEGLGGNEPGGSGGSGSGSSQFGHTGRPGPVVSGSGIAASSEMPPVQRFYESPHARAVAFVEAQLGERLREDGDGPILGMEFDPLPPGAFGAPIVEQSLAVRPYEAKLYRHPVKGGVKAVPEYKFLPEQPSGSYDRATSSHYYNSPTDIANRHSFPHGNDQITPSGYGFQGPPVPPQQVKSAEIAHKSPIVGAHPITGIENPFAVTHEEEIARTERKRKNEEARLAKEVEAHEKRIRKELEKQDMMRRKREEQIRKEMERQDRERRKEEERLLREKQREEERYQREQRREMERRVKFLQKESMRAEKLRIKEDMRKEKEAARLKAANDRAAARRIAKESLELIDDERLELMEIAASTQPLSSIDTDTMDNLDSLRDMLPEFPPKSVHLKMPFKIQPWTDSEENIGNLLMVWKFLITFADVLGLWPFTLDEFVQAFHDHDPRLLGEIHVALLISVVKDIEDVARAPSSSLGANQTNPPNPGGGHPQIVEGAFAWGFDIRSWQKHLNPLTWPEILRQFSLAAGYGPKLKKRNVDQAHPREDDEGVDGGDIILNLRSGLAAENALAKMQERGFSNRRSRHRLTPGTVKYAAFHVLSLEGSRGLSILDVAHKIQKSGLRDLTTSKTPEASIAAALSRDTKLFERTAPSTYCLKSPYRKDPADMESVINAAREKIRIFKNGLLDEEEAFDAENEKDDDDSESDVEVDDIGIGIGIGVNSEIPAGDVKVDFLVDQSKVAVGGGGVDEVVDESFSGEGWVQGLMEGEYSDLSVEERLNALVALIAVANEGNSVRVVLEERLEAAMALKKQMWAEAQVDKRRFREDFTLKIQYPPVDDVASNNHQENTGGPQTDPNVVFEKSRSQLKGFIGHKAEEMYVYRSLPLGQDRRRNRYWQFVTCASQNDPGSGRIFVELRDGRWRVIDSEESFNVLVACLDIRGNREAHLHSMLQRIEPHFKASVNKSQPNSPNSSTLSTPNTIVDEFSSSFSIELGRNEKEMNKALKRYQDFEKWMWAECLNLRAMKFGNTSSERMLGICDNCRDILVYDNHKCSCCGKLYETCFGNDLQKSISQFKDKLKYDSALYFGESGRPVRFRLLKTLLALTEASIPVEALQPSWTDECRKTWCLKLVNAVTVESLLEGLTLLESAIKREFLCLDFETTDELLGSNNSGDCSSVFSLPWLPETTSSVALRLMELDTSIYYLLTQKEDAEKDKPSTNFLSLHPVMKKSEEGDPSESLHDPGRGRGCGRGRGRARGGRPRNVGPTGSRLKGRGARGGGRGGRKRGRRGVHTKQQKAVKLVEEGEVGSPVVGFQEWNDEEIADLVENASSSEYEIGNDNNEYDDDVMMVDDDHVPSREYGLIGEEEEEDDDDEGIDVDGFFNDDSEGGQVGNNPDDDDTEMSSSGYSD